VCVCVRERERESVCGVSLPQVHLPSFPHQVTPGPEVLNPSNSNCLFLREKDSLPWKRLRTFLETEPPQPSFHFNEKQMYLTTGPAYQWYLINLFASETLQKILESTWHVTCDKDKWDTVKRLIVPPSLPPSLALSLPPPSFDMTESDLDIFGIFVTCDRWRMKVMSRLYEGAFKALLSLY